MKKAGIILTSIVGGAVIGSTITMLMAPKSGEQMRSELQKGLAEKLDMLHEHIKKCKCMMAGDCDTSKEGEKMSM